jgi:hypothetical protein
VDLLAADVEGKAETAAQVEDHLAELMGALRGDSVELQHRRIGRHDPRQRSRRSNFYGAANDDSGHPVSAPAAEAAE